MKTLDEQVLSAATGTLELFGLYLGDRLGPLRGAGRRRASGRAG